MSATGISFSVKRMTRGVALVMAALTAASLSLYWSRRDPYPVFQLPVLSRYAMLDLGCALGGLRRLGADIAWVQTLQYYGSSEKPLSRDEQFRLSWDMTRYLAGRAREREICGKDGCTQAGHYHPQIDGGLYPELYPYCLRVTNLDPFFTYAYLYGSGALAWNIKRPDEARALLYRGLSRLEGFSANVTRDHHLPFWQLHLYAAAILYQQKGDTEGMVRLLEQAARAPGAPNLMKAVLANVLEKQGRLADAMTYWLEIARSGDAQYAVRSREKIASLRERLSR